VIIADTTLSGAPVYLSYPLVRISRTANQERDMKSAISYFELHTPDPARAQAFYGELFNWKFKDLEIPGQEYFEVQSGGDLPGGMMRAGRGAPAGFLSYFAVGNLDASLAKAKSLGATVVKERTDIPEGSFAVITDPVGATLALWQKSDR
jgi:predicted enzyme related to lactoylglutathione lyase